MKSNLNNVTNPRLLKMLKRTLMYNFEVKYKQGNQMAVADWGSRSPCTEGAHQTFIKRYYEIGITVKSLRIK